MPSQNASTAVSAATAAGKFAAGDYVGAAISAVSAIAGLFGGGGEGYAQSTGYEIKGTVSGGAFQGAVTGLSSNGIHNYRISEAEGAYGERADLNSQVSALWKKYFPDNPSNVSFPLDFTLPYDWLGTVRPTVEKVFGAVADQRASEKSLLDLFKGATALPAPDVAAITGGAIGPTGAATPGAAAITGAVMPVNMLANNPLMIAAALLALLFIMKGK